MRCWTTSASCVSCVFNYFRDPKQVKRRIEIQAIAIIHEQQIRIKIMINRQSALSLVADNETRFVFGGKQSAAAIQNKSRKSKKLVANTKYEMCRLCRLWCYCLLSYWRSAAHPHLLSFAYVYCQPLFDVHFNRFKCFKFRCHLAEVGPVRNSMPSTIGVRSCENRIVAFFYRYAICSLSTLASEQEIVWSRKHCQVIIPVTFLGPRFGCCHVCAYKMAYLHIKLYTWSSIYKYYTLPTDSKWFTKTVEMNWSNERKN